LTPSYGKSL